MREVSDNNDVFSSVLPAVDSDPVLSMEICGRKDSNKFISTIEWITPFIPEPFLFSRYASDTAARNEDYRSSPVAAFIGNSFAGFRSTIRSTVSLRS